MASPERARVLCVDDEPMVLEGLNLTLRRRFDVVTAPGGAAALALLKEKPVAVVMSDMRMPAMDGAALLAKVRVLAPDTTRVLLTGQADLDSAVAAVNDGQVFRFLTKPCPPNALVAAIDSAVEQHRLVTAERVLLEQTLRGSVKMLTDVLSLTNPVAFGRANRVKVSAGELAKAAGVEAIWRVEVAAMFSQLGYVTLTQPLVDKLYAGRALTKEEQEQVDRLPEVAEQLIANLPRLEDVRSYLANANKRYKGTGGPPNGLAGEKIPIGARILKIVLDFDLLEGNDPAMALDTMRGRDGWYDPRLLDLFTTMRGIARTGRTVLEIPIRQVQVGMTFADDVRTPAGLLLLPRGHEVTVSVLDRIRNFPVPGNVRVIA